MSIRPIDLQTNFAQQGNVDKARQGEFIHEQAEKAHISDVADEITRDNLNVNKTSPGDVEDKIKDDEKGNQEQNSSDDTSDDTSDDFLEDSPEDILENNDEDKFRPKHQFEDPNKGKIVDIKL